MTVHYHVLPAADRDLDDQAAYLAAEASLGASRRQPLFFVFGRGGIHRTETGVETGPRSDSGCRTSGGTEPRRDFLARERERLARRSRSSAIRSESAVRNAFGRPASHLNERGDRVGAGEKSQDLG
jgi:hypothetical protein